MVFTRLCTTDRRLGSDDPGEFLLRGPVTKETDAREVWLACRVAGVLLAGAIAISSSQNLSLPLSVRQFPSLTLNSPSSQL